ncbi:hypothetical protein LINPERPRIM_LOCUS24333 [Linum perenne]
MFILLQQVLPEMSVCSFWNVWEQRRVSLLQ